MTQAKSDEIYPWSIRGLGDSCQAFHCLTGKTGPAHPYIPGNEESQRMAHALAMEDVQDFQVSEKRLAA
jgi:hypothetical protein